MEILADFGLKFAVYNHPNEYLQIYETRGQGHCLTFDKVDQHLYHITMLF